MVIKTTQPSNRKGRKRVQCLFGKTGKTEQAHKESCDIKNIMSRVSPRTTHANIENPGMYGDFSNVKGYQDAMDRIKACRDEFMELDPVLRARFDNDPANLLDFLSDETNRGEAEDLGIIVKAPQTEPQAPVQPAEAAQPEVPVGGST